MRPVVPGFTRYTEHAERCQNFEKNKVGLTPAQLEIATEKHFACLKVAAGIDCTNRRMRIPDKHTHPWKDFLVSRIERGEGNVCFVVIHKDNNGVEQRVYIKADTDLLISNTHSTN